MAKTFHPSTHLSSEHPRRKALRCEEETAVSELRSHTGPMENSPCVGRTIKMRGAQQLENLQFVSKKEKKLQVGQHKTTSAFWLLSVVYKNCAGLKITRVWNEVGHRESDPFVEDGGKRSENCSQHVCQKDMDPFCELSKNITVGSLFLGFVGSQLSGGVRGAGNRCPAPSSRVQGQESL